MGTSPLIGKKIIIFISVLSGPSFGKGKPELPCFKPGEAAKCKRDALPRSPQAGLLPPAFCLGRAGPPQLTGDLSCFPAPVNGLCPPTLQVGPVQVPNKQLHSPGTLSCLQLSCLCIPANSHTPGTAPAAYLLQPPFPHVT